MQYAIFSDIHGNLPALETMIADARNAGISHFICLGDIVNAAPFSTECVDLVRSLDNCVVLQGNHEKYVLGDLPHNPEALVELNTSPDWANMRWARDRLRPDQLTYLANLPLEHEIPLHHKTLYFTHGSPASQFLGYRAHHTPAEMAEFTLERQNSIMFVGHTHRPLYQKVGSNVVMVVGSVGMPLDDKWQPTYTILTVDGHDWHAEYRSFEYDLARTNRVFVESGLLKEGGVFAGIFRYQINTGHVLMGAFAESLREFAAQRQKSVADIIHEFPVPPEIKPYLT